MEQETEEYYIKLLTFTLGISTQVLQLYFDIKILKSEMMCNFLERNKHALFPAFVPNSGCCKCDKLIAHQGIHGSLTKSQFESLFERDNEKAPCHQLNNHHTVSQYCICCYCAKTNVTVENMDITLICVIIQCCCAPNHPGNIPGNPMWLRQIREARNEMAHLTTSAPITREQFNEKFQTLEQAVINLANVVSPVVSTMFKKQVMDFKTKTLSVDTIKEVIQSSADSNRIILEAFVARTTSEGQQLREDIKRQIVVYLEKFKEELSFEIRNYVFEVRKYEEKPHTNQQESNIQDSEKCYVEWRLAAPEIWNLKEIETTLKNVSSLIGQFFKIEFVHVGSIVIVTSVPKSVMKEKTKFELAVKSFLEYIVDMCKVYVKTQTVVKVDLVIWPKAPFEGTNVIFREQPLFDSNVDEHVTNTVQCKFCQKSFLCEKCMNKDERIKALTKELEIKKDKDDYRRFKFIPFEDTVIRTRFKSIEQDECPPSCAGLTEKELSYYPTDKHLVRLAEKVGIYSFDRFVVYLGLAKADWEEVEYMYKANGAMSVKFMALHQWRKKKEGKREYGTLKDLLSALQDIEDNRHHLCQIFRERTDFIGVRQEVPEDHDLVELSQNIGNCAVHLGIELGLSVSKVEDTIYAHSKSPIDQVCSILKEWKENIQPNTLYNLMLALQHVMPQGVHFLEQRYNIDPSTKVPLGRSVPRKHDPETAETIKQHQMDEAAKGISEQPDRSKGAIPKQSRQVSDQDASKKSMSGDPHSKLPSREIRGFKSGIEQIPSSKVETQVKSKHRKGKGRHHKKSSRKK